MVQVSSHRADLLQGTTAEGTTIAVLSMMLPQHSLLPEIRLGSLILGRRGDRRCGRRRTRRLVGVIFLRSCRLEMVVRRRNG